MTKYEAVVLSAFTGVLLCDSHDYQVYVEGKLGRPFINTEFDNVEFGKTIKKLVRPEAMVILNNLE